MKKKNPIRDTDHVLGMFAITRDQMEREWLAWRQLCKHLAKLGVDINANEPLACAIRLWGEELVALRDGQPEYKETALKTHRDAYADHVIDNGEP